MDANAVSPKLREIAPVMIVADVDSAAAYYTGKLGFTEMFRVTEPMQYAALIRDGVQIHITTDFTGGGKVGKGGCYITVDGVDAIYDEIKGNGANIALELEDRSYQMRDFYAADCCGNTIGFGQPVRE